MAPLFGCTNIWTALLVFARSAGILRFAPVIGGKSVTRTVRITEAFLLTLIVSPSLWYEPIHIPAAGSEQLLALVSEFLVGMAIGAVPAIFFSALTLTGSLVERIGGFSAAAILDPDLGEENGPLAVLLRMTGIAVFLAVGGLEKLTAAVLALFKEMPPGAPFHAESILMTLTEILSQATLLGVRVAFPVFTALSVFWITAALLNRVLPHLSLLTMTMTFSGNLLVTLAALYLALGAILLLFQSQLPDWSRFLPTLFTS